MGVQLTFGLPSYSKAHVLGAALADEGVAKYVLRLGVQIFRGGGGVWRGAYL